MSVPFLMLGMLFLIGLIGVIGCGWLDKHPAKDDIPGEAAWERRPRHHKHWSVWNCKYNRLKKRS